MICFIFQVLMTSTFFGILFWIKSSAPYVGHLMTKPTKWQMCRVKTQISLGIHPVWSESSLSAWRKLGSEDSDQTGRMPRLIWVFAGHTCHFVGFVMRRLFIFILYEYEMHIGASSGFCRYLSHYRMVLIYSFSGCPLSWNVFIFFFGTICWTEYWLGGWAGRWCWVASSSRVSCYFWI